MVSAPSSVGMGSVTSTGDRPLHRLRGCRVAPLRPTPRAWRACPPCPPCPPGRGHATRASGGVRCRSRPPPPRLGPDRLWGPSQRPRAASWHLRACRQRPSSRASGRIARHLRHRRASILAARSLSAGYRATRAGRDRAARRAAIDSVATAHGEARSRVPRLRQAAASLLGSTKRIRSSEATGEGRRAQGRGPARTAGEGTVSDRLARDLRATRHVEAADR